MKLSLRFDHLIVSPAEQFARARTRRLANYPAVVRTRPVAVVRVVQTAELDDTAPPPLTTPMFPTDVECLAWAFKEFARLVDSRPAAMSRTKFATRIGMQALGVPQSVMESRSHLANICRPRMKVIAFVRACLPDVSGPQMGRLFHLDHSSVFHTCRKYAALIDEARRVVG